MVDFPQGNCWVWKSTVKANQDLCRENWVIQFLRLKSKKTSWSSSKHHPPTKVFNLPSCKLTVGRWKHSSSNPFVNGRVELGKNYSSDLLGVWARMVFQEIMFCWVVLGDMTTKHICYCWWQAIFANHVVTSWADQTTQLMVYARKKSQKDANSSDLWIVLAG